ncbi:MAG: hypothetical protein IT236_16775, partial [Bacteroidia bacterium]|nr:hypothetical protein [Bacteroidia bacterium]
VSVLLLSVGAVLLLLSALLGKALFGVIYNQSLGIDFWPYGFYTILTAFFNSYFKTATVCLIYLKRANAFLLVNFINFIATIGISILGLHFYPDTLVGPMYGRLLSGLVIFILAHFIFLKNGNFVLDKSFLPELTKFCSSYIIIVIASWVLGQMDRYFLQNGISKAELNSYDLILKCFFGIEFIQNSLSAVIFPKLFEIWNKNKNNKTTEESNRYFNVFTVINTVQLIVFCVLVPVLYPLIIHNATFYQSKNYIGVLAAGYVFRSILNFYISTIMFTQKTQVLLKIFGLSAVIQIVLIYFGVKFYGLNGAIYAGLITKVLQVIFAMRFTKSIFEYDFNRFKIVVIPFMYFLINVLQFTFFEEYSLTLYLLQLLVFSVLFYLIFRNEIKKLWHSYKPV